MTDEIFDYFSGNSARKVEPLDDSELFDDLKPLEADAKAVDKNPAVEPDQVREELEIEIIEEIEDTTRLSAEQRDAPVEPEAADRAAEPPGAVDSHWDVLASSLGINPSSSPKPAVKSAPSNVPRKPKRQRQKTEKKSTAPRMPFGAGIHDESAASAPTARMQPNPGRESPLTEPLPKDEYFGLDSEAEPKSDAGNEDVLAEIFEPREHEFGSEESDIVDVDVNFDEETIDDLTEDDADEFADFSAPEAVIEDGEEYVEFEVTDLEVSPERGPRRRRRRPRGSAIEPAIREVRDDRGNSRSREETAPADHGNQGDVQRGARRGKPRRPRSEEEFVEADRPFDDEDQLKDADEERTTRPERSGRRRRRGRRSSGRTESTSADYDQDKPTADSDESDGEDTKRKPNIPTWDDAIGGMIQSNIQRHKSGSGFRGGGRKRR